MTKLIKKEFSFTAMLITYLFIAAAGMTMLPGYPILCGPFFICLGLFYTYQGAREGNDVLFSSLLPVKKGDVVRAKYVFVVAIELISFAIMTALTLLRMAALNEASPYAENALMNANLMSLGFSLMIFASFNILFLGGFWKDAYKIGMPFVRAMIAIFLVLGIGESIHFFPGMKEINTSFGMIEIQYAVLGCGVLAYILGTLISMNRSVKRFEKIDLSL